MESITKAIRAAINNNLKVTPGYLEKTLESHNGTAGSVFDRKVDIDALRGIENWGVYNHPDIMSGCRAFSSTDLAGKMGIVPISQEMVVTLTDPKGTGHLQAHVPADEVDAAVRAGFGVVVLGPEKSVEVIFTAHPGAPVRPSKVTADAVVDAGFKPGADGAFRITGAEAMALGFEFAKVVW